MCLIQRLYCVLHAFRAYQGNRIGAREVLISAPAPSHHFSKIAGLQKPLVAEHQIAVAERLPSFWGAGCWLGLWGRILIKIPRGAPCALHATIWTGLFQRLYCVLPALRRHQGNRIGALRRADFNVFVSRFTLIEATSG